MELSSVNISSQDHSKIILKKTQENCEKKIT